MFTSQEGLKNHWHVVAFSQEIARNSSIRKTMYDESLLLWRDSSHRVHVISNCCAHKRAPLAVSDYQLNELTCPYHGWKYAEGGQLIDIPSSPHVDLQKLKCSIPTFPIIEQDGFIWMALTQERPDASPPKLIETSTGTWKSVFMQETFETTEELLIENFMDAIHTATIHKGIIRGHQTEQICHTIEVTAHDDGVLADFEEQHEQIAIGLRWFLGKDIKVKHTDEFLLPNLVRVNYHINEVHRFQAFIACTPISKGKTQAYIRLAFDFKVLNPIIRMVLPMIAKKVLQQDLDITTQQYRNQQLFPDVKEKHVDADLIHNNVRRVRKAAIGEKAVIHSKSTIQIHV